MRAIVINLIGNAKLKFIDIRDTILIEEIHKKDSGEALTLNSVLNVENKGKNFEKNFNEGNSKGKLRFSKSKSRNERNVEC